VNGLRLVETLTNLEHDTSNDTRWHDKLPVFASSEDLLGNGKWHNYMQRIYGNDLSNLKYPLDLKKFKYFDIFKLKAAGIPAPSALHVRVFANAEGENEGWLDKKKKECSPT